MIALHPSRHLATASVRSTATQAARHCRLVYCKERGASGQFLRKVHWNSFDYTCGHQQKGASFSSLSPKPTLISPSHCIRAPVAAAAAAAAAATSAPTAKLDLSTPPSTNAIGHAPTSPGPKSSPPPSIPQNSSSILSNCPRNYNFSPKNSHSLTTAAKQGPIERTRLLVSHFSTTSSSSSSSSTQADISGIMTSLPISEKGYHSKAPAVYTTRKVGAPNTLEHRIWIERDGVPLSPFHDIPLYANEQQNVLNMVVEVPRWTNAKMEISKEETLNPIKQDIKKNKLRYVRNCFPHKGYLWNYGAFPQTWEDPGATHPETKANGDNDPLDVCEIGELVAKPGEVKQVKVLGVMALLDEGETDWKIIVIDVNDPLAPKLNDVEDVERHLPGLLRATNEWFRIYKIPDGKPENQFAFSGECKNRKYATEIIRECAEAWERLTTGKTQPGDISLVNTTVQNSPHRSDPAKLNIPKNENLAPAPIDPSIDKWFYISGQSS